MTLILNGTDNSATTPAVTGTDTDTGIYYPTSNQVALATNGTQAMLVDASQNVGIGTSSPGYKLNVGNTSAVTALNGAGITLFTSGSLTSNIGGVLNFRPGLGQTASDIFNLSICAYDHSGDGNADGLSINGADGVSFSTGGNSRNERVRIDGSGNLLVGNTASGYGPLRGVNILNQDVGAIIIGHTSGTSSGNGYINFNYNGSAIGSISQNGTTAVAYNTSSDYRLKENIAPMTGALAKVAALKPCTYTWKSAPDEVGEGFIAHELEEVCPHAVTGEKDAVDEDGNPKYQGIDTSFLVATLTAAIQELKAEFDAYKATHP